MEETKLMKIRQSMIKNHAIWIQSNHDYYEISDRPKYKRNPKFAKGTISTLSTDDDFSLNKKSRDDLSSSSLGKHSSRSQNKLSPNRNILNLPSIYKTEPIEKQIAKHLELASPIDNPYRNPRNEYNSKNIHFNMENRVYSKSRENKNIGSYSCIFAPSSETDEKDKPRKKAVKKENVMKALTSIAKRKIYTYDTRIVETGALINALQDVRMDCPGMAAIFNLHRRFIDAASLNPNPWLLHTKQIKIILREFIPWLDKRVIDRLVNHIK